jgi:hypothetical protein
MEACHERTDAVEESDTSPSKDDNSDSRRRERKRRRKHDKKKNEKKKKHRHRRRQSSSSSSDDDDDDDGSFSTSSSSLRHKKHSKKKRKKSHNKKHHKKKKAKKESEKAADDSKPSFGKYGILKPSDRQRVQRSFEMWLLQVKGITSLPKYQESEYFEEYREDFNTATLPHPKYYDYDSWEMQEYQKQQQERGNKNESSVVTDERKHREFLRKQVQEAERAKFTAALSTLDSQKIADMRHQEQLKVEMEIAFRTGNRQKYNKLKEKLQPDEKKS